MPARKQSIEEPPEENGGGGVKEGEVLDIAKLKEMNIASLTQVAKDLGVVGAAGVSKGGDQVRITLLPYQYSDDMHRAVYFALIEVNGVARVESFELMRNERPDPASTDFERVNDGEHGLWIRSGPTYVQAATGIVRRAPERFNWAKFGTCFIPLADRLLGQVGEACHSMGDFPGCVSVGSGAALLGAALYCAYVSWNG